MKGINLQNDCARGEDNLEQITEIVEDIVIGVSSSTSQKQISLVEPKKRNETAISHINETGNFREISPSRNEDFLELNSVLPVNSTQSKACNKNMHCSKVGDRIDGKCINSDKVSTIFGTSDISSHLSTNIHVDNDHSCQVNAQEKEVCEHQLSSQSSI